jgi:hypothetical protein
MRENAFSSRSKTRDHIEFTDKDFMVFGRYVRCSRSYECEKSE